MTYYYWSPSFPSQGQQFSPQTQPMQQPFQPLPNQARTGGTMAPIGFPTTGAAAVRGEESYIENILRLNRGKPGTFYFTVPEAATLNGQGNTKVVRGVVEAAGRDHAIIRELQTNHRFLFPMIYFDFAEFDEELAYFDQTPR